MDENGNPTDRLTKLFAQYNETHDLIHFCGHTHMPLYLFWSFHTYDGFPEIYLPRMTELYGAGDNEEGQNTGIAVEVEVYEDEVLVRGRDFYRGEWRMDEDDDDNVVPCERTFKLKNPIAG